jgi:hypothetical protein
MTGCIIISQKKTVVLETAIEILHSNIINNNKQLASTAICYSHLLETNIRQEFYTFLFTKFVFVKISYLNVEVKFLRIQFNVPKIVKILVYNELMRYKWILQHLVI